MKKPKMSAGFGKWILLALSSALCAACGLYLLLAPAAWINGAAVDRRELRLYMEAHRAEVISEFEKEFSIEYGPGFWSRRYGAETPAQALRNRALGSLIADKLRILEARRLGVIDWTGYSSFLKELERENKRREQTVNAGGVIYGPKDYSEAEYFFYLLENISLYSMQKLNEESFELSEADLLEFYELEKQSRYRNVDISEVVWVSVKGNADEESGKEIAAIRESLEAGLDWRELEPGGDIELQSLGFGGEGAKGQALNSPEMYAVALTLLPGEVSEWLESDGRMGFLLCVDRLPGGYLPFEECRDHALKSLLEQRYREYIEGLTEEAKVVINKPVWGLINID